MKEQNNVSIVAFFGEENTRTKKGRGREKKKVKKESHEYDSYDADEWEDRFANFKL